MINLSDKAADKLFQLKFEQARPDAALRIAVLSGDCAGLNYFIGFDDFRGNDDFVVKSMDHILFLDSMSAPYLWGSEIDWIETDDDAGFVIFNPNKGRSQGGCGKDGNGCMTKGDGNSCMNKKKQEGGGCGSSCGCSSTQPVSIQLN